MVTAVDWLHSVAELRPWSSGGQRAPHKPLLLMTYLAPLTRNDEAERLRPYSKLEDRLLAALAELAPSGRTNAHYPWIRLANDEGIWVIPDGADLPRNRSKDVSVRWLRDNDPVAGVPVEAWALMQRDRQLVDRTIRLLLAQHFPPNVWPDVLALTGVQHDLDELIDIGIQLRSRARRDPAFRPVVVEAFGGRCAVCSYAGRDRDRPVGVEAAHIRWHTHQGPDSLDNGLALCALHHALFDRGMFTLNTDLRVQVSPRFSETGKPQLLAHDEQPVHIAPHSPPAPAHLQWHRREVFRASA